MGSCWDVFTLVVNMQSLFSICKISIQLGYLYADMAQVFCYRSKTKY